MKWPGRAKHLHVKARKTAHNVCNKPSAWGGTSHSLTNGRHVLAGVALASDKQRAPLKLWLLVKESQQALIQILGHLCFKCTSRSSYEDPLHVVCFVCARWIMKAFSRYLHFACWYAPHACNQHATFVFATADFHI